MALGRTRKVTHIHTHRETHTYTTHTLLVHSGFHLMTTSKSPLLYVGLWHSRICWWHKETLTKYKDHSSQVHAFLDASYCSESSLSIYVSMLKVLILGEPKRYFSLWWRTFHYHISGYYWTVRSQNPIYSGHNGLLCPS